MYHLLLKVTICLDIHANCNSRFFFLDTLGHPAARPFEMKVTAEYSFRYSCVTCSCSWFARMILLSPVCCYTVLRSIQFSKQKSFSTRNHCIPEIISVKSFALHWIWIAFDVPEFVLMKMINIVLARNSRLLAPHHNNIVATCCLPKGLHSAWSTKKLKTAFERIKFFGVQWKKGGKSILEILC